MSKKLRGQGFREDLSDGAPICRWVTNDVILDVMPTDSKILGFGNRWYETAAANSKIIQLPANMKIRMVSAPYFLITKLEAFEGRGGGDYLSSHDIEDIIAVLDGRSEIVDEVKQEALDFVRELSHRFKNLLNDNRFVDAVSGHLPADNTSQSRVTVVLNRIKQLVEEAL